jgi:hypothetical protein
MFSQFAGLFGFGSLRVSGDRLCEVVASCGKHENRGRKSWKIEDFLGAMAAIEDLLFYGSYVKR